MSKILDRLITTALAVWMLMLAAEHLHHDTHGAFPALGVWSCLFVMFAISGAAELAAYGFKDAA